MRIIEMNFEEVNKNDIDHLFKNEKNMIINDDFYIKKFVDIANGEHKHFIAKVNDKIVGTSSLTKFLHNQSNTIRIYHRSSWTHPDFRNNKIWFNLMKHKSKFIKNSNWCDDNTINFVAVSKGDTRYKKIGWKQYNYNSLTNDIWYTYWKYYKNV